MIRLVIYGVWSDVVRIEFVKFLADKGINLDAIPSDTFETPFLTACRSGKFNVVKFLFLRGVDIYYKAGIQGELSGFYLACFYGHLDIVKFFFSHGVSLDQREDRYGRTGFHLACQNGKLEILKFFLENEYDKNDSITSGDSGFHFACRTANMEAIQFLIQNKCDVNLRNNTGSTGLEFLIQDFHSQGRDDEVLQERIQCLYMVIESGANFRKNGVEVDYKLNGGFYQEFNDVIGNRIFQGSRVKDIIFEKFTGRIAQCITDFTLLPITDTGLKNLKKFYSYYIGPHSIYNQAYHPWLN
jgi:hypothetical protein